MEAERPSLPERSDVRFSSIELTGAAIVEDLVEAAALFGADTRIAGRPGRLQVQDKIVSINRYVETETIRACAPKSSATAARTMVSVHDSCILRSML